jgi:uncharacterized protein (DUF1684 family)
MTDQTYQAEIETWRRSMDVALRKENGWLALAGLYWLEEGSNRIGSDPSNRIVLPERAAPAFLGDFHLSEGVTQIKSEPGQTVQVDAVQVEEAELDPDITGMPSRVTLGDLSMVVIKRGARYGIRLWDNHRPERESFPGREWYAVQEVYRIEGRFIPHQEPVQLTLPGADGGRQSVPAVGLVHFELDGAEHQLEALEGPSGGLFLIFRDETNGTTTYEAGRYLQTDKPKAGQVVLDFNRAFNPPCVFTAFATCALPPPQNYLQVSIKAGEMDP